MRFERLTAVGFDLWETLLTNPQGASLQQDLRRIRALREILSRADHDREHDEIERAYRGLWDRCHELYWSRDLDIPTRRHIEYLLDALSVADDAIDEVTLENLEAAYSETILDHPPQLVEHAVEMLQRLRAAGLRIGLISNTGRTPGRVLRRVLQNFGVADSFDAMIFSNEVGVCKPQEPIFRAMLEALGSDPATTAFVGDNIDADVFGAKSCGMIAIHFVPERKGTAVAPPLPRAVTYEADQVVTSLAEVPAALAAAER